RSSSGRARQNPQQQLSTIEKSVTHLLVATKQLLETLTHWSRGAATENDVSDVYVRLGYEFNIACRAFNAIGVDTADLGPVPDLLRGILEDTLSQEASQASLDRFLPRIRDIIINLLHGLKKKQQRLRQKSSASQQPSGGSDGAAKPPRQASVNSNASAEGNLTQQLEDLPSRHGSGSRSFAQRQNSGDLATQQQPDLPPRTTSTTAGGGRSSPRRPNFSPQNSTYAHDRDTSSSSSLSSTTMPNMPIITPYPETDTIPTNTNMNYATYTSSPRPEPNSESEEAPPRPPPKQNDALTALQRGGELERRASRRFSAYQIQKHLGTSINGISAIPPAQHSPAPNRGREAKEGMSAVRSRGTVSGMHNRARSRQDKASTPGYNEPSPHRAQHEVRKISEEPNSVVVGPDEALLPSKSPAEEKGTDSPTVKTPEDKLGYPFPSHEHEVESVGATLNGPIDEPFAPDGVFTGENNIRAPPSTRYATPPQSQYGDGRAVVGVDTSPQPNIPLTLFLQYRTRIKKYTLPNGSLDLTIPRLQLAFIEAFAWQSSGQGELPEIYIQDPVSGVRYELEDLGEVRERSVLVLNVEVLEEVKRVFEQGLGEVRRVVERVGERVEEQGGVLRGLGERQREMGREVAVAAAAAAAVASPATSTSTSTAGSPAQLEEVRSMRRDLAIMRQTYTSFVSDMNTSIATIRSKASTTLQPTPPTSSSTPAESSTDRAYLSTHKTHLHTTSESIVNRVDDLQDTIEDLRKDVVTRGVRPLPRQLESVSKEISLVTSELKKLQEFLRREKPVWTKIWERELQVICEERDLLTMQEELARDLEDDLDKGVGIFELVERASRQQNLQGQAQGQGQQAPTTNGVPPASSGSRSASRTLPTTPGGGGTTGAADPGQAREGVLGEVRALQPNHESRLEAIERAERARRRELESRKQGEREFARELGVFVEEGRLKKSGGVEEVERVRRGREERARREMFEREVAKEREREGRE
ncbi:hypothetical protein BAUCODRAFT_53127, partial [Baudoinia panamericana UAMH 10762]